MMREDLRRRLRELGVVQGVGELRQAEPCRSRPIEDLVPGEFHTTSRGQCFVVDETYPVEHRHGDLPLSTFLRLSTQTIAQIEQEELAGIDLRRVCFLDTETTGLSGGAGTMAFVVGLGFFVEGGFQVRQYFLRDPGDEPAMVEALMDCLPTFEALISFNGRAFDVPIIENRFILARAVPPTQGIPHFDLLHPARRLWRYALSSCALTSLERDVLGVRREQADVPSGVIPYLYRDYLRTGDARDMKRVLYHNKIDILSMVTLAARLCRAIGDPWNTEHRENQRRLGGEELYALGRWYTKEGRVSEGERAYRDVLRLESAAGSPLRRRTLRELAYLLKRDDRRHEALAFWQQLALESDGRTDGVLAHVELAKYFEWHVEDLVRAAAWTRAALEEVEAWSPGMRREGKQAALRHRLSRLERKMADEGASESTGER
ncbi:MAG: ribonuclease H-like domain-containing protein [Chloroflexota bacterium]|nr:ribonuclease H-like domain-containing protein [Chloroflexota bacterium]